MGFVTKTWKDPVNIDSNNLNRIEQGIKNSHDTLEILEEEVSNLQTKQLDILEQLKTSTPNISSDTILEQLNSILGDTEILTALKNANNFLTKSAQELTKAELNQVYKNLDLDRMLKLTDIRVNDTSVVQGSIASITLPKIDKTLNLNSNNAISNSAVVRAINKLIKDIENNTTFYLKDAIEDNEHMTVSKDEIVKWNSIDVDLFLTEESDPTVPAWAKASTKPIYTYNEIVGTPTIPTDNIELENGRGYITSSEASTIANNLLSTFQTNTINPLSSRVTNLEAMDITITNALNNKADANHTHSNLASIAWVTEEIEDKIAELVGSAPATLDTIQELAAALSNNADIIDIINSTIANKATIKFGNTIQTTVTFDSDPQIQIDNKFDKTGGNITGDTNIVNGQGLVLTPASVGSTYYAFKFYAQGDDVFVEKQKVEGGADYQKLLPLDSSLSITSENAVQNRVVSSVINTIQETLNNKTTVNINNVPQSTINFDSDPQTQINNLNANKADIDDIPTNYVTTNTTQNISGEKIFESDIQVGVATLIKSDANGAMEFGRRDGNASTPYIDFHTDGKSGTDYNSRILASGDSLFFTAGGLYLGDDKIDAVKSKRLAPDQYNYRTTGGLIVKCGKYTGSSTSPSITFYEAFPTACVFAWITKSGVTNLTGYCGVNSISRTGFTSGDFSYGQRNKKGVWIAIGY